MARVAPAFEHSRYDITPRALSSLPEQMAQYERTEHWPDRSPPCRSVQWPPPSEAGLSTRDVVANPPNFFAIHLWAGHGCIAWACGMQVRLRETCRHTMFQWRAEFAPLNRDE
jgi:hypothetical protein